MPRLKKLIVTILVTFAFISTALCAGGATIGTFQGGVYEALAELRDPYHVATVNITIPAECHVLNASMTIAGVPVRGEYPLAPEIYINDVLLWTYAGTGYGRFGNQTVLSDGSSELKVRIGPGGGKGSCTVRLPRGITVQKTGMDADFAGSNRGLTEIASLTKGVAGEEFGISVSSAGDVNGDGYDDLIIGAERNDAAGTDAGRAYIYFGGLKMDTFADVVLTGAKTNDNFGVSVSSAGDVNNDGFDDVIAGAYGYDGQIFKEGSASIFLGGEAMDSKPDYFLTAGTVGDLFGQSVSTAGDVNGDGYDDVLVGAPYNNTFGEQTGSAYIYYGGPGVDERPDVVLTCEPIKARFGWSVSTAGDMNNDSYDDVIVSTNFWKVENNTPGSAYIYLGGPSMDNLPDVIIPAGAADHFARSVSDAGDVNNDGYDDVIVGYPNNHTGQIETGRASIYFGGAVIDNILDRSFFGYSEGDDFGFSVSSAGDVNQDGFDDLLVGAPRANAWLGASYVFLGGEYLEDRPAAAFSGTAMGGYFGYSVSKAGDLNGDGFGDIIAGARYDDGSGNDAGRAVVYSPLLGLLNSTVSLGQEAIFNKTGYTNGTERLRSFGNVLSKYLVSAPPSGTDRFGNQYVDVPITVGAESDGNITITNLSIEYYCKVALAGMAPAINEYLSAHRSDRDVEGNIAVPIVIRSRSPGGVKLYGLNLVYDGAPFVFKPFPALVLDEDTRNDSVLDLHQYFKDEHDPQTALEFSIQDATNSSTVRSEIRDGRFLSVDALTGPNNDNWTGVTTMRIRCTDSRGSSMVSGPLEVAIRNVNDPPVIASSPSLVAEAGEHYEYEVLALDGDRDVLRFGLERSPGGMTIDNGTGMIRWVPSKSGDHPVTVVVNDAVSAGRQDFIISVPNLPPEATSQPVLNATSGVPYFYNVTAKDKNNDSLGFSLAAAPAGMHIHPETGSLNWTPEKAGTFFVSVKISDGISEAYQNYTIKVNGRPRFTSVAETTAYVGVNWSYTARASDEEKDVMGYSLGAAPFGMTIDAVTGKLAWTPSASGNHTVVVLASDGKGGEAAQEFTITVLEARRPTVRIDFPSQGERVRGKPTFKGAAAYGTWDLVRVQVRVDSGEWVNATGTGVWTFSIDTADLGNGKHTLEARAFDGHGYSESARREFVVDNGMFSLEDGTLGIFMAGVAILLAAIALGAVLLIRRRKRRPDGR